MVYAGEKQHKEKKIAEMTKLQWRSVGLIGKGRKEQQLERVFIPLQSWYQKTRLSSE